MRAFGSLAVRSSAVATGILAAGLILAGNAAHAAVRVYVGAGPAEVQYYAGDASSYGGNSWIPAYYDGYGNYYPGRWVRAEDRRDREWREHEWREQERREHEWREQERREHRDGDREYRGDGYRDEHRDRDDRHHDRDDDR